MHSEGSLERDDPACQASHQEGHQGSGGDGEEEDSARSWDSSCPQAFVWDKKSSLMVCVDGEKKIWYQARVVGVNNSQYLLSWPGEEYPAPQSSWKMLFHGRKSVLGCTSHVLCIYVCTTGTVMCAKDPMEAGFPSNAGWLAELAKGIDITV